ncbi:MAG TPA: RNA polymerase sigma factor [Thermoleophilaceae bacterium]|nr:RNA polymerase sigma factor [Thermoleophilaceae bacterium]
MATPRTRRLDPAAIGDHLDRLYRVAMALCGSRERAEDLVQDTYVRVLSKPRFLRNDDDLAYLVRVLRNMFISQHRRDSSRPALATAGELDRFEDATAPPPDQVLESRLVYKHIAALPPNFRDALVAVDVAGLRYREAAHALGVGEATLTSRLFRARQRVAEALAPDAPKPGKVCEEACVLVADPTLHRKDAA